MEANQRLFPEIEVDETLEATKNVLIFRAIGHLTKTMLPFITTLVLHNSSPEFKKAIAAIKKAMLELMAAFNAFELVWRRTQRLSERDTEMYEDLKDMFMEVVLIPYRCPVGKLSDCRNHFGNFISGNYAVVDSDLVFALQKSDDSFSAGMMELINRSFPNATQDEKEYFARNAEKLIERREQLGIRI